MGKTRREFLKASGAGIAVTFMPSAFSLPAKAGKSEGDKEKRRPNILYLHVHDIGRYCQPYGYPVPTPNMQRLAEEGVLFHQAFTAGPTCSPSRASLLTGQLPHSCGMMGLTGPVFKRRGFKLNDPKQHIVNTLKKAGYRSSLIGIQHVARRAKELGYDEMVRLADVDEETKKKGGKFIFNEKVGKTAVKWLGNTPKEPFFVSVGFEMTHRHFIEPGPNEDPRYCRPPEPIPNTAQTRRDMAGFKACVRFLDEKYGEVLQALEKNGLKDNTLVICTTEHGIAFPTMKCNLTDHGIGVMLIMRGPGGFTGGRVVDAMVSQIDIFPTVCELLGIETPGWVQGKSFMPVIRGEVDEINEQIISEVTYHGVYEPKRAVRTKRWKYIKRFGGRQKPVSWNCDPGPGKDLWLEHGWDERFVPDEYLYDLMFDPMERDNLFYSPDPEIKKILEQMRARLEKSMKETADPLLKGPVPDPAIES